MFVRWTRAFEITTAMRVIALFALARAFVLAQSVPAGADREPLAGPWGFRIDPEDSGVRDRWFDGALPDRIRLPGSLQEQGFGDDVSVETRWTGGIADRSWFDAPKYEVYRRPDNIKIPFWLQPKKHYVGVAWYERSVSIPRDWADQRITLRLERCHWTTSVWVDGQAHGKLDSLSTPHVYDLSEALTPGRHRLTLRVDNRLAVAVGVNAHSVSDHTQTNWNGIVGEIALHATDRLWIDDVQAFPDPEAKSAKVVLSVRGARAGGRGTLTLDAVATNPDGRHDPAPARVAFDCGAEDTARVTVDYALGEGTLLWDEFHPTLYRLRARLDGYLAGRSQRDETKVTFGMRTVETRGTRFFINDRPLFLRGTLECSIFPRTGYPPTDVDAWKRIVKTCKAHGLNHIRFHSWCPPEAAFRAADELGFYYQVEGPCWTSVGRGEPIDAWIHKETERILRAYGNHPSFLLMAYGNEPSGPGRGAKFLRPWVARYKARDPRRLFTGASGWPIIPENQYHVTPAPRIHQWGEGIHSRINGRPPETMTDYGDFVQRYNVPVVAHEIGQWCVYPNFDEMHKYSGVLQPKNFEVFREFLTQNHMGDQAREFLMASGRLQVLCYKEEIESALRTPGFGGFQLLDLHDFPGQGTALVGILDPFWDAKPYVGATEFRRFSNTTVPLARLEKRIWTDEETFAGAIEVAHHGERDLGGAVVLWALNDARGRPFASGRFPGRTLVRGGPNGIGRVEVPLEGILSPQKLCLVVRVEGSEFENDWEVWVYPARLTTRGTQKVRVARQLDDAAVRALEAGERVLLLAPARRVRTPVTIGFSSVFWNTAWTRGQPPHTLGLICDPDHPALSHFPTEAHSNWQWWELVHGSAAMLLDGLPAALLPIVQPIDTWFESRRLGLLFEARIAQGRLLVSSMDLTSDLERRPVARQMRYSLMEYVASDDFDPQIAVAVDAIRELFRAPTRLEQLGATISADSAASGYPATNAIDGDPATIWHTPWGDAETPMPHELRLTLERPLALAGITYLPRQDMANGRISRYELYVSDDGRQWEGPIAEGVIPDTKELQRLEFDEPRTTRFLKLVALAEVRGQPFAAVGELDVMESGPP